MIRKKIATAFALGALILVAAAPTASATGSQQGKHNGFIDDMVPVDLFYGFEGGFVLYVGATPEDFCTGTTPTMVPARVFQRQDGTVTVKAHGIHVDLFLYEFDGPAPALIDVTCAAIFDGDPSTQPPQPLAVGTGRVKITLTGVEGPDDIGGFHVANSVNGTATAEDESKWRVRGHASFDVDEDGFPIGDPADFQGLRLKQIRRGQ